MKRIILATLLIIGILVGSVVPALGASIYTEDYDKRLEVNIKRFNEQKTDEYILNAHKQSPSLMGSDYYSEKDEIVEKITKGLTSDYAKAKVIADWVSANVYYVFTDGQRDKYLAQGIPNWRIGVCEDFANATEALMRKAGLSVKKVIGEANGVGPGNGGVVSGWQGHAWNHVFIDGRWVYVDTTWREFDKTVEEWSRDHYLAGDEDIHINWQGSFTIKESSLHKVVYHKEQLPLYASLPTDIGIDQENLYLDADCTRKIDPKTWQLDYVNRVLWVKHHKVVLYLPTENGGLEPYFMPLDGSSSASYIEVGHGSTLPQVIAPPRVGYTFIGWKELNSADVKILDTSDVVTKDIYLEAVYQKGEVSHKVTFNTNGGTAVKEVTTKAYTNINRPADPTKQGYKFTGWYRDSANTDAWNFSKDVVSQNTTLYAGWVNQNSVTATGTSSTVLVNNSPTVFEAYTIEGNNYFKLRDLAQAVNHTSKNFEVTWASAQNAINLLSETPYTSTGGELAKGDGKSKVAIKSTATINKDGAKIPLTAYTINSNNFFKLRDIAEAFNIEVTWDGNTNTIGIDTGDNLKKEVPVESEKQRPKTNDEMTEEEKQEELYWLYKDRDLYEKLNLLDDVERDIKAISDITEVMSFLEGVYTRYHKEYKESGTTLEDYMRLSLNVFYDIAEDNHPKDSLYYVEGPEAVRYVIEVMSGTYKNR